MTLPPWMTAHDIGPWYAVVTFSAVVTSAILSAKSLRALMSALAFVLRRPSANFTLSEGLSRLGGGEPLSRSLPGQMSPKSAMNQGPSPAATPLGVALKSRALGRWYVYASV